jgi:hypothetical protein
MTQRPVFLQEPKKCIRKYWHLGKNYESKENLYQLVYNTKVILMSRDNEGLKNLLESETYYVDETGEIKPIDEYIEQSDPKGVLISGVSKRNTFY